jgi:hypothetical protein
MSCTVEVHKHENRHRHVHVLSNSTEVDIQVKTKRFTVFEKILDSFLMDQCRAVHEKSRRRKISRNCPLKDEGFFRQLIILNSAIGVTPSYDSGAQMERIDAKILRRTLVTQSPP